MKYIVMLVLLSSLGWASNWLEMIESAEEAKRNNKTAKAIQICEKILTAKLEDSQINQRLGYLLIDLKKADKGFELLQKTITPQSNYHESWQLASVAEKNQKFEIAAKYYEICLDKKVSPEVHEKLALIFEELNQISKSLVHRSKSVELQMPQVRGLSFLSPIELQSKDRKSLAQYLRDNIDKDMPPEKVQIMSEVMKAFGFIPESCDVKQTLLNILSEQIGGFYHLETKELFLIAGKPQKGFWAKFNKSLRDDSEDRIVIAHEMTHALQDQHYDLLKLQKKIQGNDDRLSAFQALIEGDASVSMYDYQNYPDRLTKDDVPGMKMAFGLISFLLPFSGNSLAKAPLVFKESLLFPYREGFFFCLSIREGTPWEKINQAFTNLPASTEHILHPEKYLAGEPVFDIKLPDFGSFLGADWKEIENNVMGELGTRTWFQTFYLPSYAKSADGWAGDRYTVWKHSSGKRFFFWATYWDNQFEAQEFQTAVKAVANKMAKENSATAIFTIQKGKQIWVVRGIHSAKTKELENFCQQLKFVKAE